MSQLVLKHPDLKHEDLKFNTVEVHAGEPRDMYGALIPPIYQTSTFYFDSTDDAVKACDDYAESFAYSRITNPSVDYLEQKLAALEHGKGAVAYASGMGAVSGAIFALLKSGDHAIFTKAKYSGTEDVTSDWLPRFGIAHDTFDAADLSQLEGLIKPNTKLIYVESPANPTMVLVDIAAVVEKGKSAYVGPEIMGKTLGVVGLGAIGVLVANAAAALGMKIVGYDPFLSVTHALNLTPGVEVVDTLPELYAKADYISLHLPMNDATRGTLNEAAFAAMKDGVRIVNLARGELVDTPALKAALDSGKCAAYVTDFPNSETAAIEGVVAIPHLGASTPESEDNCAMMAAREVKEYLDNGSIINSVNLPNLTMAWAAKTRVCVISKGADAAAIAGAVPAVASASNTRGEYAYTILDTDAAVDEAAIAAIPGVLRVRVLTR